MHTSIVSGKGAVVIPQVIRERYGLKKGDKVHFIDYAGAISIVPVCGTPVESAAGMLNGKGSLIDELVKDRRRDADSGK